MERQVFTSSYRRSFFLKIASGLLLLLSFCGFGLYLYLNRPFGGDYLLAITELDRLQDTIFWAVAVSATVQLVVFILLFYFASIYWTHKVAGPLYRLKMTFQRLVTGDWSPMYQVRNGDQLKEIPGLLNRVLEEVGSTDTQIRDKLLLSVDQLQEVDGGKIDNVVLAETRRRLIKLLDKYWPI